MKSAHLGLCLLASSVLLGCAPESDDCLPGDIDCTDTSNDDKLDAWNRENDPKLLAERLEYRLASLPRSGKINRPIWRQRYAASEGENVFWSDTYWPTQRGSTNARWLGPTVKSPLEKYDQAFNAAAGCDQPAARCGDNAKSEWDRYIGCAGPAAKWHSEHFQGSRQMYDGVDSDGDRMVDECDGDGIAGWWGLCHAWTPAAILEPEPKHAVTKNGVTFEVADIKALIVTLYDDNEALMLGGRCNGETFPTGPNGERAVDPDCQDVNPGALHVILANFLGVKDRAIAMDRTAGAEVWNQPIYGFEVKKMDVVDAARANACIGDSGTSYTRNAQATKLHEVQTDVEYLVEGQAEARAIGMSSYIHTDSYHYILEVSSTGKVIGGTYCTDSVDKHPDFLWAPLQVAESSYGRNPHVDLDHVRELIDLSRRPQEGGGGPVGGTTYTPAGVPAIPDNDPAGTTFATNITTDATFSSLVVEVDISHTYVGDLDVSLVRNDAAVKVLSDNAGGATADLKKSWTFSAAELGTSSTKAVWGVKVVDTADGDAGRINGVKLTFMP